jgi:hypothetical protein
LPGSVVQVLGSSDLVNWEPITQLTNLTGTLNFTDPGASNFNCRFYKTATTSTVATSGGNIPLARLPAQVKKNTQSGVSVYGGPAQDNGAQIATGATPLTVAADVATTGVTSPQATIFQTNFLNGSNFTYYSQSQAVVGGNSVFYTCLWTNPLPYSLGNGTNGKAVARFIVGGIGTNSMWDTITIGQYVGSNAPAVGNGVLLAFSNNPVCVGKNPMTNFEFFHNATGSALYGIGQITNTMTVTVIAEQDFSCGQFSGTFEAPTNGFASPQATVNQTNFLNASNFTYYSRSQAIVGGSPLAYTCLWSNPVPYSLGNGTNGKVAARFIVGGVGTNSMWDTIMVGEYIGSNAPALGNGVLLSLSNNPVCVGNNPMTNFEFFHNATGSALYGIGQVANTTTVTVIAEQDFSWGQ